MESCIEDNSFILRLFYTDINNIPSGYVRVMSFNISIRHQQTGPAYVFKKPVIKYYHKSESDDGLEISTTVDVNEVRSEAERSHTQKSDPKTHSFEVQTQTQEHKYFWVQTQMKHKFSEFQKNILFMMRKRQDPQKRGSYREGSKMESLWH